jgi:hypothetical protein
MTASVISDDGLIVAGKRVSFEKRKSCLFAKNGTSMAMDGCLYVDTNATLKISSRKSSNNSLVQFRRFDITQITSPHEILPPGGTSAKPARL